jgi:speckle-type POZ protein
LPYRLINRKLLNAWTTDDDCLTIECTVTVYKKPQVTLTKSLSRIEVPRSDIAVQFGRLLETKDVVDVSFILGEENLTAHKIVLATRSPVFKAELFGPLRKDGTTETITIRDL